MNKKQWTTSLGMMRNKPACNLYTAFRILLPGLLVLLCSGTTTTLAAPASDYWAVWDKSNERSKLIFDHSQWDFLLQEYLSDPPKASTRLFNYAGVAQKDRERLKAYISQQEGLDPREYPKNEQMAYWINLYNAVTVDLVLGHYPVGSIREIGPWYKPGPWDMKVVKVAGYDLSLNDIEHRILRPIWQDPRIHYVVNCASLGCPDLAQEAFSGEALEQQLELAAQRFINQSKAIEFLGDQLSLSSIFDWYRSDFGDRNDLLEHLQNYLPLSLSNRLKSYQGKLEYRYNWDLNQIKPH